MLALLADLYTPLFFLQSLWLAYQSNRQRSFAYFALISCAGIYTLYALDLWLKIWPEWGMDFSTHTAIIVPSLWLIFQHKRLSLIYGLLALSYLYLMIELQYHTLVDIVSTLLFVTPWVYFVARRFLSRNSV